MKPVTLEHVRQAIEEVSPHYLESADGRPPIDHKTRFEDAGLDSLDSFEIGLAVEKMVDRALPSDCDAAETVGEFIDTANEVDGVI